MLSFSEIKKGVKIIFDGEPYEVLEARHMKKARGQAVLQTKVKNLISGNLLSRNFSQSETFEEAELSRFEAKFLYYHRGQYFFSEKNDPSKRFNLSEEQIGETTQFLQPDQIVEGLVFKEKVINIALPIKVNLKVTAAPPGVKGERAQSGTKQVTLETGAKINVPLFINRGDIIEINTEKGEYVRRVEKK